MNKRNIVIGILVTALMATLGINFYSENSQGQGVSIDGTEIITISPTDQASFVDNWVCVSKTGSDNNQESDYYYFKKSDYELLFNKSYVGIPDGGYVFPEALEPFQLKVKENKAQARIDNSTDGTKIIIKKYDVKEVL
jgi:hypothetical protein